MWFKKREEHANYSPLISQPSESRCENTDEECWCEGVDAYSQSDLTLTPTLNLTQTLSHTRTDPNPAPCS